MNEIVEWGGWLGWWWWAPIGLPLKGTVSIGGNRRGWA